MPVPSLRSFSHGTLLLLALCAAASQGGCGPGGGGNSNDLTIAVIPKGTSHQFWRSVHAGAEQAAAELGGVKIVWQGPAQENNTAGQIEVVKNMITRQVDGIVLAPNHSQALVDAVQEAGEEGIPVVIFDSGIGEGAPIVSYVATDNREGGRLAARRLVEVLGGEGDVILLRYRAGSESTEQREEGFLEELAAHEGIRILSSDQYGDATTQTALEKAQQLLLRYQEEVDGIFAVCEPNANGTLLALEQTGLAGRVKFIAFDPSDSLIRGLEAGTVHGIVLQDPVKMGYTAVKSLVAHLKNEPVEPVISTGEHVATLENMREPRFQELLQPKLHGE